MSPALPVGDMHRNRILIAGFGNSLVGDDGAGPAVVARLRELGLPPGVRAEDCGSDALHLPGMWRGEAEVWLVDAVKSGATAGTICRLSHDEVLAVPQRHATVHSLSLAESLRWIALAYPAMASVRYRFWGIEVERLELVEGLSARVAAVVGQLAGEILSQNSPAGAGAPA
jgi:hydrogenase maturation protease